MTEIKGHTATGCSARLIDDGVGQATDSRGSQFTPARGNLSGSRRPLCCWCAIHRLQHRAKVVNAARNYRFCASRAAHGGAGSGWLALETRSDKSQLVWERGCMGLRGRETLWWDATVSSSAPIEVGGRQRGTGCRVRDAMRVPSVPWPAVSSLCAEIQALRSLSAEPRRTFVLITGGRDCLQR